MVTFWFTVVVPSVFVPVRPLSEIFQIDFDWSFKLGTLSAGTAALLGSGLASEMGLLAWGLTTVAGCCP